jgi:hypothetical protein
MKHKSLKFHIKSDDYFGTLATIISLIKQDFEVNLYFDKYIEVLDNVEKDLIFLQKNYFIKLKR